MIDSNSKRFSQYILTGKRKPANKKDLLIWAENNRVLYSLAHDPEMEQIKSQGKVWIEKLTKTIDAIENVLKKDEYIITRTYKYIEYVTFDVDLFVKSSNFKNVVDKFRKEGFSIESHDSSLGGRIPGMQVNIKKNNLLTIDLHQDFTWQKRRFLNHQLVMENPRKKVIAGKHVDVPSAEVELLLCIADIAHERFNITLLDLIWLEGLSKEVKNWDFVFEQVRLYRWSGIFKIIASIINQFTLDLYGTIIIKGISPKQGSHRLPYFLDLPTCWLIYMNTLIGYLRFPIISFMYMHYNQFKYLFKNQMPYYSPWYK